MQFLPGIWFLKNKLLSVGRKLGVTFLFVCSEHFQCHDDADDRIYSSNCNSDYVKNDSRRGIMRFSFFDAKCKSGY